MKQPFTRDKVKSSYGLLQHFRDCVNFNVAIRCLHHAPETYRDRYLPNGELTCFPARIHRGITHWYFHCDGRDIPWFFVVTGTVKHTEVMSALLNCKVKVHGIGDVL